MVGARGDKGGEQMTNEICAAAQVIQSVQTVPQAIVAVGVVAAVALVLVTIIRRTL